VVRMLPGAPPQLQPVLWEVLLRNSSFREKDKVLEALSAPPDPAMQEAQQQALQVQMAGAMAEIENTQADTANKLASAEAEQANTAIKAVQAGMQAAV